MKEREHEATLSPDSASLFSCCIAIVLSLVYVISRFGFHDLHLVPVAQSLGVALFILCIGQVIDSFSAETRPWYLCDSFIILASIFGLMLLGMLVAVVDDPGLGKYLLPLAGYASFARLLYNVKIRRQPKTIVLITVLGCLFGIWAGSIFWGYGVYSPLYFESFAIELPHVDTLFHNAIAQMIKTYNVATIGVEGLQYFPYHFGSHFLFAQLSNLLKLDLVVFYPLSFPVIFIPTFLKVFLQFIDSAVRLTTPDSASARTSSLFFWVIFFWGFLGVVGFNYLNRAGTASYAVILSESYTLSLILLFLLLELCLRFWIRYSAGNVDLWEKIIFAWILIPVIVAAIALVKISTNYITLALAGYTLLRLRLFRDRILVASLIVTGVASLAILFLTRQFNSHQGEWHPFHFFNTYIDVPAVAFVILFYWWVWVLMFMVVWQYRVSRDKPAGNRAYFALEIALVTCVVGLIPGASLELYGGSAIYFLEPQYWIALSLTLCYVSRTAPPFLLSNNRRRIASIIATSVLAFFMLLNLQHHFNLLRYKNLSMRKYMSDGTANLHKSRRQLRREIFDPKRDFRENWRRILFRPQAGLDSDKEFKFFKKLRDLSRIKDKSSTMLFIPNKHGLHSTFPCNAIPFAIPALTGMATIHGIPYDYCPAKDYGFDQFDLEPRTEIGKLYKFEELCSDVKRDDCEVLVILNFEDLELTISTLDCRNTQITGTISQNIHF